MNFIIWLAIGGVLGWLASLVMKTDASMGAGANIIVGIVGALIGGFIMNALGGQGVTGFNIYSLLVAIGGAIILLFLVRAFRRA